MNAVTREPPAANEDSQYIRRDVSRIGSLTTNWRRSAGTSSTVAATTATSNPRAHLPAQGDRHARGTAVSLERRALQALSNQQRFDAVLTIDAMENVPPEEWPLVLSNLHRAVRPGGLLYLTVDEVDESVVNEAFNTLRRRGRPVVRGEVVEGDVAGYHYYPDRAQVLDWFAIEGLEVVEEGFQSSYHDAVNRREYARAYAYWEPAAAERELPLFDDFVNGHADTASVELTLGRGGSGIGAGQLYFTVPVTLVATMSDRSVHTFVGCDTLHLARPQLQAVPLFSPMGIQRASVPAVDNDAQRTT